MQAERIQVNLQAKRKCPEPDQLEVTIQVKATGLCGSDLHCAVFSPKPSHDGV